MEKYLKKLSNPALEEAVAKYQKAPSEKHKEEVISQADRLVRHFVKTYSYGSDEGELKQAGYEGLMKALKRFDPERGVLFGTYASHCIKGEIRREIRREKTFYRPNWMIELQHTVLEVTDELTGQLGRKPTRAEIAEAANIKEEGLSQIMQAGRISLEELDQEQVRNQNYVSFQLPIEDKVMLARAVQRLSKLQKKVLFHIYFEEQTQQETADRLDMSQRQVSRVLHKSLALMAKTMM